MCKMVVCGIPDTPFNRIVLRRKPEWKRTGRNKQRTFRPRTAVVVSQCDRSGRRRHPCTVPVRLLGLTRKPSSAFMWRLFHVIARVNPMRRVLPSRVHANGARPRHRTCLFKSLQQRLHCASKTPSAEDEARRLYI